MCQIAGIVLMCEGLLRSFVEFTNAVRVEEQDINGRWCIHGYSMQNRSRIVAYGVTSRAVFMNAGLVVDTMS